jgi:hypothetical protein
MKFRPNLLIPLLSLTVLTLPGLSHADTQVTAKTSIPDYLLIRNGNFTSDFSKPLTLNYDPSKNTFSNGSQRFGFISSNQNSYVKFKWASGSELIGDHTKTKIPLALYFHSDQYTALNTRLNKVGDEGSITKQWIQWNQNSRKSPVFTLEVLAKQTNTMARPAEDDYSGTVVMEFSQGL